MMALAVIVAKRSGEEVRRFQEGITAASALADLGLPEDVLAHCFLLKGSDAFSGRSSLSAGTYTVGRHWVWSHTPSAPQPRPHESIGTLLIPYVHDH
jgi:hypothetical protein